MKKKIEKMIATRARETACELCDADCIAPYKCEKEHKSYLTPVGTETICPLAKYNISFSPKKESFLFGPVVSLEDLFYVCADCKHASVKTDGDELELGREGCFETVCIDCPVQMCRDNIIETAAEAAMS